MNDTKTNLPPSAIDAISERLYETYCDTVGGKAFNGDPLPGWKEFANDPGKEKQANAWREAAKAAYPADMSNVSDGYHTFGELYDHRFALLKALMSMMPALSWKSRQHHDGTMFEGGYFICGIDLPSGTISYHYKLERWNELFLVPERERAPEWDGHTSTDVLHRLHNFVCWPRDPISEDKAWRRDLDFILQRIKTGSRTSRERSHAISKLQECIMWLGMDLKELGTPNPYPESKNPDSPVIHPPADGLKL